MILNESVPSTLARIQSKKSDYDKIILKESNSCVLSMITIDTIRGNYLVLATKDKLIKYHAEKFPFEYVTSKELKEFGSIGLIIQMHYDQKLDALACAFQNSGFLILFCNFTSKSFGEQVSPLTIEQLKTQITPRCIFIRDKSVWSINSANIVRQFDFLNRTMANQKLPYTVTHAIYFYPKDLQGPVVAINFEKHLEAPYLFTKLDKQSIQKGTLPGVENQNKQQTSEMCYSPHKNQIIVGTINSQVIFYSIERDKDHYFCELNIKMKLGEARISQLSVQGILLAVLSEQSLRFINIKKLSIHQQKYHKRNPSVANIFRWLDSAGTRFVLGYRDTPEFTHKQCKLRVGKVS